MVGTFIVLAGSIELRTSVPPVLPEILVNLDMLLNSPEMNIQLVQMFKQGAKGHSLSHLGEGTNLRHHLLMRKHSC